MVFLNDIAELPLFGKIFLYADDACLLYAAKDDDVNARHMNEDLEVLRRYFNYNYLALNVAKTKVIHFHDPRKHLSRQVRLAIDGEPIEEVKVFRYLGLVLDSHLTWGPHVDFLCDTVSKMVGIFYRVRDEIPLYALKRLYYGLVHSKITYMITLWGNAPASALKKLQILQSRLFKLMYRLALLTPTLDVFARHVGDVLPIKGLQIHAICKYVKECLVGSKYHTVPFTPQLGSEFMRDNLKLNRTSAITGWGLLRLSFQGPTFYNLLPKTIRELRSVNVFNKALKLHLFTESNLAQLLNFRFTSS